jgi:hypothetical protein
MTQAICRGRNLFGKEPILHKEMLRTCGARPILDTFIFYISPAHIFQEACLSPVLDRLLSKRLAIINKNKCAIASRNGDQTWDGFRATSNLHLRFDSPFNPAAAQACLAGG